jgi:hypothetical protein
VNVCLPPAGLGFDGDMRSMQPQAIQRKPQSETRRHAVFKNFEFDHAGFLANPANIRAVVVRMFVTVFMMTAGQQPPKLVANASQVIRAADTGETVAPRQRKPAAAMTRLRGQLVRPACVAEALVSVCGWRSIRWS